MVGHCIVFVSLVNRSAGGACVRLAVPFSVRDGDRFDLRVDDAQPASRRVEVVGTSPSGIHLRYAAAAAAITL